MAREAKLHQIKPCLPYRLLSPHCPSMQNQVTQFGEIQLIVQIGEIQHLYISSEIVSIFRMQKTQFGLSSLCQWVSWVLFLAIWGGIVFCCLIALNPQIYIFPFPYFATGTTFTQIKCEKQTKKSSDFPLTISQLTPSWHKCWPTSSSYITDPVLAPVLFGLTFQY